MYGPVSLRTRTLSISRLLPRSSAAAVVFGGRGAKVVEGNGAECVSEPTVSGLKVFLIAV